MLDKVKMIDEPALTFRYSQQMTDPRDGLSLFGPCDTDEPGHPSSLSFGAVGTRKGIDLFSRWSKAMVTSSTGAPNMRYGLWPPFPGFEATFACDWITRPILEGTIASNKLIDAARRYDPYERVYLVVSLYLEAFGAINKLDAPPRVMVCIVPDIVYSTCRIQARVAETTGRKVEKRERDSRKLGQLDMFSQYEPDQYRMSLDFRRQIKARTMQHNVPIQIVRESTLRLNDEKGTGDRQLTPLSNRMWNLASALFYKGGGRPWRLACARDGVCYVGLAFRRCDDDPREDPRTAACAAQMFWTTATVLCFWGTTVRGILRRTDNFTLVRKQRVVFSKVHSRRMIAE